MSDNKRLFPTGKIAGAGEKEAGQMAEGLAKLGEYWHGNFCQHDEATTAGNADENSDAYGREE